MKSIDVLKQRVTEAGASLDDHSFRHGALVVDAPPRHVWTATGTHALRADFVDSPLRAAVTDIAARIALGVQPCDLPDCDHCEEARLAS